MRTRNISARTHTHTSSIIPQSTCISNSQQNPQLADLPPPSHDEGGISCARFYWCLHDVCACTRARLVLSLCAVVWCALMWHIVIRRVYVCVSVCVYLAPELRRDADGGGGGRKMLARICVSERKDRRLRDGRIGGGGDVVAFRGRFSY